jgi:hypothetical protein
MPEQKIGKGTKIRDTNGDTDIQMSVGEFQKLTSSQQKPKIDRCQCRMLVL